MAVVRICDADTGDGPVVPKYCTLNYGHSATLLAMDNAGVCHSTSRTCLVCSTCLS